MSWFWFLHTRRYVTNGGWYDTPADQIRAAVQEDERIRFARIMDPIRAQADDALYARLYEVYDRNFPRLLSPLP